jgi:hypothetical protein
VAGAPVSAYIVAATKYEVSYGSPVDWQSCHTERSRRRRARPKDLNRKTCNDLHLGISEAEATQLRVLLSRIRSELTAARLNDDPPSRPQAPAARSRELADCDDRHAGDPAKGGKETA